MRRSPNSDFRSQSGALSTSTQPTNEEEAWHMDFPSPPRFLVSRLYKDGYFQYMQDLYGAFLTVWLTSLQSLLQSLSPSSSLSLSKATLSSLQLYLWRSRAIVVPP